MNAPVPRRGLTDRGVLRRRAWPPARGFTLVEVLVTTAVTLVAFTGLATLQIQSLRATSSSLERSGATALAYEIVDRMRLNRGENGLTDTALGGGYDDLSFCNYNARHPQDQRTCVVDREGQPSGGTYLSAYLSADLRALWSTINSIGLPHWYVAIDRTLTVFTVSVQWDDTRAQDTTSNEAAARDSCVGTPMPASMQEVCVMTRL